MIFLTIQLVCYHSQECFCLRFIIHFVVSDFILQNHFYFYPPVCRSLIALLCLFAKLCRTLFHFVIILYMWPPYWSGTPCTAYVLLTAQYPVTRYFALDKLCTQTTHYTISFHFQTQKRIVGFQYLSLLLIIK